MKVYLEKADERMDSSSAVSATTGRDYLRQRRRRARTNEDRWQSAETFARELHDTLLPRD